MQLPGFRFARVGGPVRRPPSLATIVILDSAPLARAASASFMNDLPDAGFSARFTVRFTAGFTARFVAGRFAAALIVGGALTALSGCERATAPSAAPQAAPPVQVTAYTVEPKTVPMTTEIAGRTTAAVTAEIRPQVGGIILKRLFTEGAEVSQGQALYQIDPAAARATVANAQAALASAQASLGLAREKAQRYRELVAIEAVSRESADEAEAAYKQAQSEVAANRAQLDTARLSLSHAEVTSPISGRIGRSSVSEGALVTASQTTALATVTQLDPIFVDAAQSATNVLRFRRDFEAGRLKIDGGGRPTARLTLEDGSVYPHPGRLLLAEAIVEETAGTITLRAQFPNPDRELLPGMYVRMTLEGAVAEATLLVPQVAVTRDAKGNGLVYVIGPDDRLEQRSLVASRAVGDQWIVESGLQAGERIVVEGLQRVRDGMTVEIVDAAAAARESAGRQPPSTAPPAAGSGAGAGERAGAGAGVGAGKSAGGGAGRR